MRELAAEVLELRAGDSTASGILADDGAWNWGRIEDAETASPDSGPSTVTDASALVRDLNGKLKIGRDLLEDAPRLVESIRAHAARKLGRLEDAALVFTEANGPEALTAAAGTTITGTTAAITYTDWLDAMEALAGGYQDAAWVLTADAYADAVDAAATGAQLVDLTTGAILGRPTIIIDGPAHATGAKVGALVARGAFSMAARPDRALITRQEAAHLGLIVFRFTRRVASQVTSPDDVVALALALA